MEIKPHFLVLINTGLVNNETTMADLQLRNFVSRCVFDCVAFACQEIGDCVLDFNENSVWNVR